MAGLAMHATQRALLITILMSKISYGQLIPTGIYLERQSPISPLTLRISFDDMQRLMAESRISSTTARLHQARGIGVGELILGLTATGLISISALARKMTRALSLIFRY